MKVGFFIDWLECYCIEHVNNCMSKRLEDAGYKVTLEPYTTRIYKEVISVSDNLNRPVATICRVPLSQKGDGMDGIMNPRACHIKLHNSKCYITNVGGFMRQFCNACGVSVQSISRVDICADFNYFQNGLHPNHLIKGFAAEKYLKIGQPRFTLHGTTDRGYNCYNSVLFGSKNSNIYTRFYCKSLEMKEVKQKNWIVDCWKDLGLDLEREVWRVEFAVKAPGRKRIVEYSTEGGTETKEYKPEVREITIDDLCSRDKIRAIFLSLAGKYFIFSRNVEGVRKYDQERLVLFEGVNSVEKWKPLPTTHSNETKRIDKQVFSYLIKESHDMASYGEQERVIMWQVAQRIKSHKMLSQWAKWKFGGNEMVVPIGVPVKNPFTQVHGDENGNAGNNEIVETEIW